MWALIVERLVLDFFSHIFLFPFWWYTRGVAFASSIAFHGIRFGNEQLAPGIWLANLFVPMFGQHDWQGRIMSFFMRLMNIIIRGLCLGFWSVICLGFLLAWLVTPPLIIFILLRLYPQTS